MQSLGQHSPRSFFKGDSELAQSMTSLQSLRDAFVQNFFFSDDPEHHDCVERQQFVKIGAPREDFCSEVMTPREIDSKGEPEFSDSVSTAPGSDVLASPLSSPGDDSPPLKRKVSFSAEVWQPAITMKSLAQAFSRKEEGVAQRAQTAVPEAKQCLMDSSIQEELHRKLKAEQRHKTQLSRELDQRARESKALQKQLSVAASKAEIPTQSLRLSTGPDSPRLTKKRASMPSLSSPRLQAGVVGKSGAAVGPSSIQAPPRTRFSPRQQPLVTSPPGNTTRTSPRQNEPAHQGPIAQAYQAKVPLRRSESQTEACVCTAAKSSVVDTSVAIGSTRHGVNRVNSMRNSPPQPSSLKHRATTTPSTASKKPVVHMDTERAIAAVVDDLQDWAITPGFLKRSSLRQSASYA